MSGGGMHILSKSHLVPCFIQICLLEVQMQDLNFEIDLRSELDNFEFHQLMFYMRVRVSLYIIVGGGKLINTSPCFCSVFICVGDTQECSKNLFEKLINHGTEFLKKSFRLWCIPLTHVQLNYHSKITIKNILS